MYFYYSSWHFFISQTVFLLGLGAERETLFPSAGEAVLARGLEGSPAPGPGPGRRPEEAVSDEGPRRICNEKREASLTRTKKKKGRPPTKKMKKGRPP